MPLLSAFVSSTFYTLPLKVKLIIRIMIRTAVPTARALSRSKVLLRVATLARPGAISASRYINTEPVKGSPSDLKSVPSQGTHGRSRITPSEKSKVWPDAKTAIRDIKNGDTVLSAGFGLCGTAETIIKAMRESDLKDLTVVSNNAGNAGTYGLCESQLPIFFSVGATGNAALELVCVTI